MTPEQREQRERFIDGVIANGKIPASYRQFVADELDYAVQEFGVSISLDSVRDHTNCERCEGTGRVCTGCGRGDQSPSCGEGWFKPCAGGSPVVWSTEP